MRAKSELQKWKDCAEELNSALHLAVGENGDGWESSDGEDVSHIINSAFNRLDKLTNNKSAQRAALSEAKYE
jgi:hypothetical protein